MDNHNIELVNSFLDAVRKRLRKREVTAAVSYLLTFAILALFAGVLGDHFFGLPATVRYIYFGLLLLSTAGFILFGIVRPLLRRFSRRYAAKLAENAFEELNGNLLAFSELESTTGPIAGALAERSLQGIERLSMTDIIPYRRIYQNTLLLCTLLFVFSAYTILSEKSTFDSLYRILMPSSAIAAPTSTALRSVSPGNYTVLEGEDVVFRVELSGVLPAEVLIRRTSGGKEVETELDQTSSGVYEGIVPAVVSGFEYSVVAGDASAGPFTIDVHPVPSINSVSFEVTPPAYSEREKWFSTDRSFDVLEGSTVRATILTSTDIRSATFLRLGKKTEMERTADRSATFEFKPRNDSSLFIRYRDTAGFESAFTAQYRIVVLPDKPPVVELLTPADGLQHPINSTLVLTGKVADDVGLRSIIVLYGPRGEDRVTEEFDITSDQMDIKREFDPIKEGWEVGDRITFRIVASDIREPEKNVTRSDEMTVRIMKPNKDDANPPRNEEENEEQSGEESGKEDQQDEKKPSEETPQKDDTQQEEEPEDDEGEQETPQNEDEQGKPSEEQDKPKDDGQQDETQKADDRQDKEGDEQEGNAETEEKPADENESEQAKGDKEDDKDEAEGADEEKKGDEDEENPEDILDDMTEEDKEALERIRERMEEEKREKSKEGEDEREGEDKQETEENGKDEQKTEGQEDKESSQEGKEQKPSEDTQDEKEGSAEEGKKEGDEREAEGKEEGDKETAESPDKDKQAGEKEEGEKKIGEEKNETPPDKNEDGQPNPTPADESKPKEGEKGTSNSEGERKEGGDASSEDSSDKKDGESGESSEEKEGSSTDNADDPAGGTPSDDEKTKKIEKLIEEIEDARERGDLDEADLEREGLTKERLEEYKRVLRRIKMRRKEIERRKAAQKVHAGSSEGTVGSQGVEESSTAEKESSAKKSEEKVTGGYRALIDAWKKSLEEDE